MVRTFLLILTGLLPLQPYISGQSSATFSKTLNLCTEKEGMILYNNFIKQM
jgi:hypothetical protein